MNCSHHSEIESLARALVEGACRELYLTPKPGLVDLSDNGSHPDLSVPIMEHSIGIVGEYLEEIVQSLQRNEPFPEQKASAIRAEERLYRELGSNTHKGYIFLSGMLLIAHHRAETTAEGPVRKSLAAISRSFFESSGNKQTHGEKVRKQFGTGGIVMEAINGYPSLFEEALPIFRETLCRRACEKLASFAMLGRLMQTVDDTTTLHRAGPSGLARVRQDGRILEQLIADDKEFIPFLESTNLDYIQSNITIGGIADMLGLAFACLIINEQSRPKGQLSTDSSPHADNPNTVTVGL